MRRIGKHLAIMIWRDDVCKLIRSCSRFLIIAVVFALAPGAGYCIPANPKPITVTQPDGTTRIDVFLKGDERLHWNEDNAGYLITKSPQTQAWVYGIVDEGRIKPTPYVVGSTNPTALGLDKADISNLKRFDSNYKNPARDKEIGIQAATTGTMKNLVVLVSFADKAVEYSQQQFDDLFNQVGYTYDGAVGSVKDYYHEVSYGALTVESTVVEAVTLDYGYAYYGANDSSGNDLRPREMVQQALAKLAQRGFNFQTVDGDGDGWVDGLTIIHAGGGEEYSGNDSNYIWSHKWSLTTTVTYNGIKMKEYHTEPARRGWDSSSSSQGITRIGVICHENGHFLGLPDLYDTDGSSAGAGNFCLMAGGSWGGSSGHRPVHPSVWCKAKLGWLSPTLISSSGSYSLSQIATNQAAYKVQGACGSKQYFLIENRQGAGFDASAPGWQRGILIWHIDETVSNNNNESRYMVDLEEASCTQHLETKSNSGDDLDYFRANNAAGFTNSTCPNNQCYSGTPCGLNILNISSSGATMTFNVIQGECEPPAIISQPSNQTARVGQSAAFSISAAGTGITYQWQISSNGGQNYSNVSGGTGATTPTYTTAPLTTADDGMKYRCVVSGLCGSAATSSPALLTVTSANVLLYEDFENDFVGGAPVGWTAQYTNGSTDWQRYEGAQNGGGAAQGDYNARLYLAAYTPSSTYLITPEIAFPSVTAEATLEFYHKQEIWVSDQDTLEVYYKTSASGEWNLLESYTSNVANWTKRTISLPNLSGSYYLAFLGTAKYGRGVCIDEVQVWQAACNLVEFTSHPSDLTVCPGKIISLSVATYPTALQYQWEYQPAAGGPWIALTGKTTTTYNSGVTAADNGKKYRCLATNLCGTAASNPATLTVKKSTTVTTQPTNQSVCAEDVATFTLAADGEGSLAYKWYTQAVGSPYWIEISGATNASLAYIANATDNGRTFRCTIYGGCGNTGSSIVTLNIKQPTAITSQPSNQSVGPGDSATFSVAATGEELSYQWQKSSDGVVWSDVGANSNTYSFVANSADNGKKYRCLVSGECGDESSIDATLTVDAADISIGAAKMLPDTTSVVMLAKAVTLSGSGFFYVQEDDRTSGIRVHKSAHGLQAGDRADISGATSTNSQGERFIEASYVEKNGAGDISPLFMNNAVLGGGDWYYNPATGAGQRGVAAGIGLNNIGLLVRVQGEVVETDGGVLRIKDGSASAISATLPTGVSSPGIGDVVVVTGISSLLSPGGTPLVIASDVRVIKEVVQSD